MKPGRSLGALFKYLFSEKPVIRPLGKVAPAWKARSSWNQVSDHAIWISWPDGDRTSECFRLPTVGRRDEPQSHWETAPA